MGTIILPKIFQSGMVLQRRKPICIWGHAEGFKEITVKIGKVTATGKVKDGEWKLYLPPMQAATGLTMFICSDDLSIEITDIAIGEVWIAGGQSNMEFLLRFDAEAREAVKNDNVDIRCFEVPKISYQGQEKDGDFSSQGLWRKAVREECLWFSAVGFYFAQRLYETLKVPVGIISCNWGGTSASVFTSREYLTGKLSYYLEEADKVQQGMHYEEGLKQYQLLQYRMVHEIFTGEFDMSIVNTAPLEATQKMLDFHKEMSAYNYAAFSPFRPCGLYETMLLTIAPYSTSGVIWYQGESDEPHTELYEELLGAMIRCWRELWQEELPFIQVQLASFEAMMEPLNFVGIRAIQEKLTKTLNKVYLICAMDKGLQYDIHPKEKKPIGNRLALQALNKVYGIYLLADSPSFVSCCKLDDKLDLEFTDCGEGLWVQGNCAEALDFWINDQLLPDFHAKVEGNHMLISCKEIQNAKKIQINFAWKPYCRDNVYNSEGLPMLPFSVRIVDEIGFGCERC